MNPIIRGQNGHHQDDAWFFFCLLFSTAIFHLSRICASRDISWEGESHFIWTVTYIHITNTVIAVTANIYGIIAFCRHSKYKFFLTFLVWTEQFLHFEPEDQHHRVRQIAAEVKGVEREDWKCFELAHKLGSRLGDPTWGFLYRLGVQGGAVAPGMRREGFSDMSRFVGKAVCAEKKQLPEFP